MPMDSAIGRVALLVKSALEVFYAHEDPDPCLREFFRNELFRVAVSRCEQLATASGEFALADLAQQALAMESEVEYLAVNVEECSGGADLTRARTRALSAAKAVHQLLVAAAWPAGSLVCFDDIEDLHEAKALVEDGAEFHLREARRLSAMALGWNLSS